AALSCSTSPSAPARTRQPTAPVSRTRWQARSAGRTEFLDSSGVGVSAQAGSCDDVGDADANCGEARLYERFSEVLCGLGGVVTVGDACGDVFDLVWLGGDLRFSFDGDEAVGLPLIADAQCDSPIVGQAFAFDASRG